MVGKHIYLYFDERFTQFIILCTFWRGPSHKWDKVLIFMGIVNISHVCSNFTCKDVFNYRIFLQICSVLYLLMPVMRKMWCFAISSIWIFLSVSLWWNDWMIYLTVHMQYGNNDIKTRIFFANKYWSIVHLGFRD